MIRLSSPWVVAIVIIGMAGAAIFLTMIAQHHSPSRSTAVAIPAAGAAHHPAAAETHTVTSSTVARQGPAWSKLRVIEPSLPPLPPSARPTQPNIDPPASVWRQQQREHDAMAY